MSTSTKVSVAVFSCRSQARKGHAKIMQRQSSCKASRLAVTQTIGAAAVEHPTPASGLRSLDRDLEVLDVQLSHSLFETRLSLF